MRNRCNRGSAFILSLAVMAGLVMIVGGFAASQRAQMRNTQMQMDRSRAREIAHAAIQRAISEMVDLDAENVLQTDLWAQLGEVEGTFFTIGRGSARIQIVDAGAFADINSADEEQLFNMGLTQEQIDSLLDWREEGLEPRPEGAKDEYYNELAEPYNAALKPLASIDELLLVRGFSPQTLFELTEERQSTEPLTTGSDEEQPVLYELVSVNASSPFPSASGQPRLNVNQANAQQMTQRGLPNQLAQAIVQRRNQLGGQFARLGQVLTANGVNLNNCATILNEFAIDAQNTVQGRLNLNTATEGALNSIPDMTPDITSAILTRQQDGFTGIGDLATIPGVSVPWLQANVDRFSTGSSLFRIRVVGSFSGANVSLEAWVSVESGSPVVTSVDELPYPDMGPRWRWAEEPGTEIILAEENP